MYPLDIDADLSFLVGRDLLQVCVGLNEVILNFDEEVSITLLADFGLGGEGAPFTRYAEPKLGAVALFDLLHDTIRVAASTATGDLAVTFKSGVRLEAYSSSDQFECFWIRNGDEEIIV